uniref:RBR-type E3 ubiquitin transferase n=1 Tax=Cannabis sativa TaxID=3483 RepID=A0A803PWK0_CANSA
MDAQPFESDLDFALRLQFQEAIDASMAPQPSSAPAAAPKRSRTHDQMVAGTITRFPDDNRRYKFAKTVKSFGEESSTSRIRVYFKGLVSKEKCEIRNMIMAGIGVALCDPKGNLIFEMRKPLLGNGFSKLGAEAKALIEALNAATSMNLERITLYCDNFTFYRFVSGRWPVRQRKMKDLMNQVKTLQGKFAYCNSKYVLRSDIKHAFKLAKDAIESNCRLTLYETCVICMEDTDVNQMFSVKNCLHRYCFSCMKQHVEVKLREAQMPKCPHLGCKTEIDSESCEDFLTPKLFELLRQHIKEAATPVTERVYCPNKWCSFLMTKSEVFDLAKKERIHLSGARKCLKCSSLFCINCRVLWHHNLTCSDYKSKKYNSSNEDAKLKDLASKNLWRQCSKCNHMVELFHGCHHITCRCGYEFCYKCGAEWKNRRATCSCPLFEENHLLYRGYIHEDEFEEDDFEEGDFEEDDIDFEDEEDEGFYGFDLNFN